MDIQRFLANAIDLQSVPAPTFHEAARGDRLKEMLLDAGLNQVEKSEIGNLYARIPGDLEPPIVISAHLDTVFPLETPLAHSRKALRIYGPGIGDNAVALAALVELAYQLPDYDIERDVWLVGNVGEEGLGNLRGMQEVVERFTDSAAAYLILEGMALGYVYHQGLPVRRYKVTADTTGGHAWIHNERPSALHTAILIASDLLETRLPARPKTTLNIGLMQGGRSINSIASSAEFEFELRSESEEVLLDYASTIHRKIEDRGSDTTRVRIESAGIRPAGSIPANHPLVSAAIFSLKEAGIRDPVLQCGSTDANLPLSRGLPAICIGLTTGGDAHTTMEYIEIEPINTGFKALLNLINMIANEDWLLAG